MERVASLWRAATRKKTLESDLLASPLNRCLNTFDLTLIGVGHMVGAGVYVVTGKIVKDLAGPAAMLSSLLAAFCALLSALCYAEFGAKVPKAGSAYTYTYICIGESVAFLIGWNSVMEFMLGAAAVAKAWSASLDALVGANLGVGCILSGICPDVVAVAAVFVLCIVIAVGVRSSTHVNNVLTLTNICLLVAISGALFAFGDVDNLSPQPGGFAPYGISGIFAGAATSLFSYIGFEAMSIAAEEAKKPGHSLPRASIIAVGIVTVLYFTAVTALASRVPYYLIDIEAPYPAAFPNHKWLKILTAVGALVGATCTMLGNLFNIPRALYAMASDGLMFRFLGKVNSWTQTPLYAIVSCGVLVSLMAGFMDMEELIELLSAGTLINFLVVSTCVLLLRYQTADTVQFPLTVDVFERTSAGGNDINDVYASIGRLKTKYERFSGLVCFCSPRILIFFILISTFFFASSLLRVSSGWFYVFELASSCIVIVICLLLLLMYVKNTYFADYQMPGVPVIPVLSMLIDALLLCMLRPQAIFRLLLWVILGIAVYFLFGINNSREKEKEGDGKELLDNGNFHVGSYEACMEDFQEIDSTNPESLR